MAGITDFPHKYPGTIALALGGLAFFANDEGYPVPAIGLAIAAIFFAGRSTTPELMNPIGDDADKREKNDA